MQIGWGLPKTTLSVPSFVRIAGMISFPSDAIILVSIVLLCREWRVFLSAAWYKLPHGLISVAKAAEPQHATVTPGQVPFWHWFSDPPQ